MLTDQQIAVMLAPYLAGFDQSAIPPNLYAQFATYLELLLRWGARTNLTAVREAEVVVRRHFGESVFAAVCLAHWMEAAGWKSPVESSGGRRTLLDLGSGAGFPGLPLKLLLPEMEVILAESQGKKAAFLREAARALNVPVEVWAARAEEMPATRQFDVVALRAVDQMEAMVELARSRLKPGGVLLLMTTSAEQAHGQWQIPGTDRSVVRLEQR